LFSEQDGQLGQDFCAGQVGQVGQVAQLQASKSGEKKIMYGVESLHIPIEWMRYCEVCQSDRRFVAYRRCDSGLIACCSKCGDERIAYLSRSEGQTGTREAYNLKMREEANGLSEELSYFRENRHTWLAEHSGEFALVRGRHVSGFFAEWADGFKAGIEKYQLGTFLLKRVTKEDEVFFIFATGL
jgi:hypothetical protein